MEQKPHNMFASLVDKVSKALEIRLFIVRELEEHPRDIAKMVIQKFGISRVTAVKHLPI